jgi:GxxExxY protein
MITSLQRANAWSQLVIGAAIEVHRIKGSGLLEEIYSKCLGRECELRNIPFAVFSLPSEQQARRLERYLKGGSGRAFL